MTDPASELPLNATPSGALEELLQRVARLAGDVPALAELDINPLIVSPRGVVAVDARVKVAPVPPGSAAEVSQLH